jgi:hypothetical protein
MRRLLLTFLIALAWLLASPSLQWNDASWVEVGATPAMAEPAQDVKEPAKHSRKKSVKRTGKPARIGSSAVVRSNQPGFHPMRPITQPELPAVTTTTVIVPPIDPRYPNVPTVAIIPSGSTGGAGIETSQDRVIRCTHQGALGGLSGGQQGAYIHNCAF